MTKVISIFAIVLLVLLLVVIRAFETSLFYDPLLLFFKTDHTIQSLPQVEVMKLFLGVLFRYVLNMIISLAILWFIFKNKGMLKFSMLLYGIFFVICISVFAFQFFNYPEGPHQPLFYVRRFLIQPLLLFLLIPAFYFFGNMTTIKK